MSQSAHMGIRAAIVARLLESPALADGRVVANRRRPMAQAVDAQVFVYLEDAVATRGEIRGAPINWRTRIRVECVARDVAGVNADDAADALQTRVAARLLVAPGLGGLALDTELQAMAWTEDEADNSLSACQAIYSVWHVTADRVIAA